MCRSARPLNTNAIVVGRAHRGRAKDAAITCQAWPLQRHHAVTCAAEHTWRAEYAASRVFPQRTVIVRTTPRGSAKDIAELIKRKAAIGRAAIDGRIEAMKQRIAALCRQAEKLFGRRIGDRAV